MKASSLTHWRLEGRHPDKKEPFDLFINFYTTQAKAQVAMQEIERQGFEHCHITAPAALNLG